MNLFSIFFDKKLKQSLGKALLFGFLLVVALASLVGAIVFYFFLS